MAHARDGRNAPEGPRTAQYLPSAIAALLLAAVGVGGCAAPSGQATPAERDTTSLLAALEAEGRKDSVVGVRYLGTLDNCRLYALPSGHIVVTAPMQFRFSGAWGSPSCGIAAPVAERAR